MSQDPEQLKEPKIYSLTSSKKDHRIINYKTELFQSLYPRRTMDHGELQKVEWFCDESLTDLVIRVDIVYTRDPFGFALERTTTRTWICQDGTDHASTKVTKKKYNINTEDQAKEGIRRRGNIISQLQTPVLGLMLEALMPQGMTQEAIITMGRSFLDAHHDAFITFTELSSQTAYKEVESAADFWLYEKPASLGGTLTIRDYILAQLNIWGL